VHQWSRQFVRIVLVLLLTAGCERGETSSPRDVPGSGPATQARSETVLICAAASTAEAVEAATRAFERANPGVEVKLNLASSAALARQIEQGAPADLFLSANQEWADQIARTDQAAAQMELLGNRLVAVVPKGSTISLGKPADLASDGVRRIAVADVDSVPAGIYARQAFVKLGLWEDVRRKLVPGDDVRQALGYVETGAADVGIVYATDAVASSHVQVAFTFDAGLTDPIRYPLVLLKRSSSGGTGARLFEFLQSEEAAAIFRRHGFSTLAAPASDADRTSAGSPHSREFP